MSRPGEDFEMNDRQHEDHVDEQARRDEETSFIRDDGYGENDFERLRNDFKNTYSGEYNFNLEHNDKDGYNITFPNLKDADDTFDLEEEREEIRRKVNYVGLKRVFQRLTGGGDFTRSEPPGYDWLERNFFLERIDVRFNEKGKIIGLAYKPFSTRAFNIIVKKPGSNPTDLMFSESKNSKDEMQHAIDKFKKEYSVIKELYKNTPSYFSQQLVEDTFFDADDHSVLSDEQIWEENQLILQKRKTVFENAEEIMEEYRGKILEEIKNENEGDHPFPDMASGQDFYSQALYITDPISNQEWFTDEAWSLEGKSPPKENYETEMNDIYDFKKELDIRIKKATSGKQIMIYEELKGYINYKELTLKTYYDKKLNVNKIVELYRRLQRTKFYRRGIIRAARWVAERFPKALAGAVLGVITTAFGIYEAVEDMAGDVVAEGTKAINDISKKVDKVVKEQKDMIDKAVGKLDKRLKDAAAKQGKLVGDALDELRKTLAPSSEILKFLLDHILWVILLLVLWLILMTYLLIRGPSRKGPRVRVKYEHDNSSDDEP